MVRPTFAQWRLSSLSSWSAPARSTTHDTRIGGCTGRLGRIPVRHSERGDADGAAQHRRNIIHMLVSTSCMTLCHHLLTNAGDPLLLSSCGPPISDGPVRHSERGDADGAAQHRRNIIHMLVSTSCMTLCHHLLTNAGDPPLVCSCGPPISDGSVSVVRPWPPDHALPTQTQHDSYACLNVVHDFVFPAPHRSRFCHRRRHCHCCHHIASGTTARAVTADEANAIASPPLCTHARAAWRFACMNRIASSALASAPVAASTSPLFHTM